MAVDHCFSSHQDKCVIKQITIFQFLLRGLLRACELKTMSRRFGIPPAMGNVCKLTYMIQSKQPDIPPRVTPIENHASGCCCRSTQERRLDSREEMHHTSRSLKNHACA
jgi:hypothetical protein